MAIELIGFSGSGYTLIIIAVLKELGLSYEFNQPANFADIKTPEYLATKHPL
jgi:glutathione S-transferase